MRNSFTAIFALPAVLTVLYCITFACVVPIVVPRITLHHEGNSRLVRRIGSRVCSRKLAQRVPIHTENFHAVKSRENDCSRESKRALSMAEGARERMARRHYDLLNSAASVPSPSVARCEPFRSVDFSAILRRLSTLRRSCVNLL